MKIHRRDAEIAEKRSDPQIGTDFHGLKRRIFICDNLRNLWMISLVLSLRSMGACGEKS
jgi:hypothetical protein